MYAHAHGILVFCSCYIIYVTIISHFLTLVKKVDVSEVPTNLYINL